MTTLPMEIINKIFLYLHSPASLLIKNEVAVYDEDHHWEYTKMYKKYYIKNILPFYWYYFDKLVEPQYYESFVKAKMVNELSEQQVQ